VPSPALLRLRTFLRSTLFLDFARSRHPRANPHLVPRLPFSLLSEGAPTVYAERLVPRTRSTPRSRASRGVRWALDDGAPQLGRVGHLHRRFSHTPCGVHVAELRREELPAPGGLFRQRRRRSACREGPPSWPSSSALHYPPRLEALGRASSYDGRPRGTLRHPDRAQSFLPLREAAWPIACQKKGRRKSCSLTELVDFLLRRTLPLARAVAPSRGPRGRGGGARRRGGGLVVLLDEAAHALHGLRDGASSLPGGSAFS